MAINMETSQTARHSTPPTQSRLQVVESMGILDCTCQRLAALLGDNDDYDRKSKERRALQLLSDITDEATRIIKTEGEIGHALQTSMAI